MALSGNRDFRLFWAGQTASSAGDAFAFVAMPLLVFQATGSVVAMGTVTAVTSAGQLAGATFSGVVVDRVNRRRLMLACDVVRFSLFGALAAASFAHMATLPLICTIAAITGLTSNLFMVSYMAAVPSLVDAADVATANGRLQATFALTYVLGSTLAGVVCTRFGAGWSLGVDALSYGVSVLSLSAIRFRAETEARARGGVADLWAGISFLVRDPLLRSLAVFQAGIALLGSIGAGAAVIDLLVYRLKHDLGATDGAVGTVLALASLGAVIGALTATRLQRRLSLGAISIVGTAVQGVGMLAGGLGWGVSLVALGGALWSGGLAVRAVGANSLRQTATPDALRGRVVAAGWVLIFSASAAGAVLITRLAAAIGTGTTMAAIGVTLGVFSVLAAMSPLYEPVGAKGSDERDAAATSD